jgi:hypothetical protein
LYFLIATTTGPHPKLSLYFFLAKTEKIFSNSSPSQVVIYPKLGKTNSARAYICVQRSTAHPPVLEQLQEFAKFSLANLVFCQLVKDM